MKEFRDFNLADDFSRDNSTTRFEQVSDVLDARFSSTITTETAWHREHSPENEAFFDHIMVEAARDQADQARWDAFAHDRSVPRR